EQRAVAMELLWAVREVTLDLDWHRLRLDAEAIDPVGEDARMPVLVAVVDLHRAVQLSLGLHLGEQALQADDAGVLADAVLLEDERVRARIPHDLAKPREIDVDGILLLSHRYGLPWDGAPCGARFRADRAARRGARRGRSTRDRAATGGRCRPAPRP